MKGIIQGIKYLMAVLLGYSLCHMMIPFSLEESKFSGTPNMCSNLVNVKSCPTCKCHKDVETNSVPAKLPAPYRPSNMYDVLGYDYFTRHKWYNAYYGEAGHGLLHHEKEEIKALTEEVINNYAQQYKDKIRWKLHNILNGYRRIDPLRGIEYILDLQLSSKRNGTKNFRFEVVKPLQDLTILKKAAIQDTLSSGKIHFILPVSSVGKRFQRFIQMFEDICLKSANQNIALLIVLFINTQDPKTIRTAEQVKKVVSDLDKKYPKSHLIILEHSGVFSRGLGMDIGVRSLPDNALMYFCDVDVTFTAEFLTRCHLNAVQGKQVYYPIVFSQYNPDIVNAYTSKEKLVPMTEISKYTGHWVHYAYGMVCLYKSDYIAVGGFNLSRRGWGGEDVELFTKHARSHINVVRARDPALIHIFHPKTCDKNLTANQYQMCIQSAGESLASRQQLGILLLDKFNGQLPHTAVPKHLKN